MNQVEYDNLRSHDEIVKAIEGVQTLLTAMSGTNTGIAAAMTNTNSLLASIDTTLQTINRGISTTLLTTMPSVAIDTTDADNAVSVQSSALSSIAQTVTMISASTSAIQSNFDTLLNRPTNADATIASNAIIPHLTDIKTKIDAVIDSKTAMAEARQQDATFLTAAIGLIDAIADNKKSRNFKKNASNFASGIDLLIVPMTKLLNAYDTLQNADKVIDKTVDLFDTLGTSVSKSAKSITLLVGSTIAIAATIALMDWGTLGKFMVMFPVMCLSLSVGMGMLAKIGNGAESKGMQGFALSIATLSLSLLLLQSIDFEEVVEASVAILGIGSAIALASRLLPTKAIAEFGKNMLAFTGSIILMAGGIMLLGHVADNMPWQSLAKGAALMLAAAGVLALAGFVMKHGANDIGKAFGWVAIGLAAFGLSLMAFEQCLQNVSWTTMGIAAASIVGMAGAIRIAGNKQTVAGAIAMLAIPASLLLLGKALAEWPSQDLSRYLEIGAVVGVAVGAYALAGKIGMTALLGAGVVAAIGGSILLLGHSLAKWPFDITLKQYGIMAAGIGTVTAAMALIGNPLTLPFILTGIAESAALGGAIYALGKGLQEAEKVNFKTATKSATALVHWAKDSIKIIASMSLKDMVKSNFGLGPFHKLGTSLAAIALAVNTMAAGTYNEYDANGKIIAVHNIGPEQYKAVGDGIKALLDSVTVPLQEFGKGGGFLRDSDAENGIEALSGIGSIVNPILDVARETDKIKAADFSGFGVAVTNLVDGIKRPMEEIGKGSSWLTSSDFESGLAVISKLGGLVTPIVDIASHNKELMVTNMTTVGNKVTHFLTALKPAMKLLDDNESVYEDGMEVMSDMADGFQPMKDILDIAVSFAAFDDTKRKAFNDTITSINTAATSFVAMEQKLPQTSKFATQLTTLKNGFNGIKLKNIELIVETAHAIESIANADLTKLERAKTDVANELFKRLDKIIAMLKEIDANTEPQKLDMQMIKIDKDTGRLQDEFRLEDERQVSLATVCLQLDQLYGLLASQRT